MSSTAEATTSIPTIMIITLGTIAQRRILRALGTISDLTANVKSCNYAEVMQANANLHESCSQHSATFQDEVNDR